MVNYYKILDINKDAQEDEIKEALKEKKRLWTQRQNAPKPEQQQQASTNLRLVPEIEEILLDKQKRKEYDGKLQNTPKDESHVDTSKIEAENLVKEGWKLFYNNEIADALMVATKATELQGDNPDAWALLGCTRAEWGEIDDAIYEYKRAIKLRPNDATFYYELGGIYENEKQWQNAMDQYSKATQIDPQKTVYRASMGSVYVKVDMYQEGIGLLEQCVKEESDNESYKYLLAVAYNDSAIDTWKVDPYGGRHIVTKEIAERSLINFEKAQSIGVEDSDLQKTIQNNINIANWALSKHWDWGTNVGSTLMWGAVTVFLVFGFLAAGIDDKNPTSIIMGIALFGIYLYFKFKPGWKMQAKFFEDEEMIERHR